MAEFVVCDSWRSCQIYRNMKVGIALRKSLEELIEAERITEERAERVLRKFDLEIKTAFKEEPDYGGCLRINASSVNSYRGYDRFWTIWLKDVNIICCTLLNFEEKMKIVACSCYQDYGAANESKKGKKAKILKK